MRPRCLELHRVLKKTGSFYYHCDWHASHYVKIMLDQIFGENISLTRSCGSPAMRRATSAKAQSTSAAFTTASSITPRATAATLSPTVFLSHSSTSRRELIGLKRLLDERAGGMIEFFLSTDDDSIAHGTIWPAEVRAALDTMSLMVIFVSSEALKSGWTYFEAGYGLHKLGTANIYCLPGTDKAVLPSPLIFFRTETFILHERLRCSSGKLTRRWAVRWTSPSRKIVYAWQLGHELGRHHFHLADLAACVRFAVEFDVSTDVSSMFPSAS